MKLETGESPRVTPGAVIRLSDAAVYSRTSDVDSHPSEILVLITGISTVCRDASDRLSAFFRCTRFFGIGRLTLFSFRNVSSVRFQAPIYSLASLVSAPCIIPGTGSLNGTARDFLCSQFVQTVKVIASSFLQTLLKGSGWAAAMYAELFLISIVFSKRS